jgi:DNA-binding GntR family transcriptional regulator
MSRISVVPSLADKAYHEIRGLIVSLELAPGAVIDERELIERLGIGRTPVREALRRLAHERLVEVYPRRGMFVTGVDVRQLARLSEVREVLEPEAARLAAERATDADRTLLASLVEELDSGGSELMGLDERIHRAVYRAAHNDLLEATLEQYYVLALRIWSMALDRAQGLEEAVEAHRALLEAILAGEGERAAESMRAHVRDFEQAMHRVLLTV